MGKAGKITIDSVVHVDFVLYYRSRCVCVCCTKLRLVGGCRQYFRLKWCSYRVGLVQNALSNLKSVRFIALLALYELLVTRV